MFPHKLLVSNQIYYISGMKSLYRILAVFAICMFADVGKATDVPKTEKTAFYDCPGEIPVIFTVDAKNALATDLLAFKSLEIANVTKVYVSDPVKSHFRNSIYRAATQSFYINTSQAVTSYNHRIRYDIYRVLSLKIRNRPLNRPLYSWSYARDKLSCGNRSNSVYNG